jgi:protein phosphatase
MSFTAFGHDTHSGRIRPHNEDSYLVDQGLGLGVVADGMGGHACGEVASKIVVDCVVDAVRSQLVVAKALVKAHHAVLAAVDQGIGRPGMGSTALAVHMQGHEFEVVWVGDSRAYLWANDVLTPITRDHSLVQQWVDQGELTPEEARIHPKRNYITQAIGMPGLEKLAVGCTRGRLHRGEQLLLCSDGLNGEVSDDELYQILHRASQGQQGEQETVQQLIQKALDNGGSDNVTAVLISAPNNAPERN